MGTDTGMVSFINDTDEMVNDGNALGWYWAFHFLQIIYLFVHLLNNHLFEHSG